MLAIPRWTPVIRPQFPLIILLATEWNGTMNSSGTSNRGESGKQRGRHAGGRQGDALSGEQRRRRAQGTDGDLRGP